MYRSFDCIGVLVTTQCSPVRTRVAAEFFRREKTLSEAADDGCIKRTF